MSEIQWVNHASFVFHHRDTSLICDPWLEGTAFDDGWSLLSPTRFGFDDFHDITHLWFSHEHPDHFSPPNIKKIPADAREKIKVVYQTTHDKKVVGYCRKAGFDASELPPGQWVALADDLEVWSLPWKDGDSMLAIRAGGRTILNLNDCIIRKRKAAEQICDAVGPIDLLLTQFSYANWEGNPDDVASRQRSAAEKLRRIKLQCDVLRPTQIIPFASFVWFSHSENAYMNDAVNRIDYVADFLAAKTAAECIVLYPGDRWEIGTSRDFATSIRAYMDDLQSVPNRSLTRSEAVPADELGRLAARFLGNLWEHNGGYLRWLLRPASAFVEDLQSAFELSPAGLVAIERDRAQCDIALSSAALAYCLRHPWGGGTLHVNGRFTAPIGGRVERFWAYTKVSERNNHGLPIGPLRALKLRRKAA